MQGKETVLRGNNLDQNSKVSKKISFLSLKIVETNISAPGVLEYWFSTRKVFFQYLPKSVFLKNTNILILMIY